MRKYQGFVVSGYHIAKLLECKSGGMEISLDLGLTKDYVVKQGNKFLFPDGQILELSQLEKVNKKRHAQDCFLIEDNSLLYLYSFEYNTAYKLYEPHIDWPPTLWINGSMMHTVSVSKPTEEADNKVKVLGNIKGEVLDTCFGLGYTSIELAKNGANTVRTFELSQSVIEIARVNPWSKEAFSNEKIKLENSDAYHSVTTLRDKEFDLVLHDPPNVKIESSLYSLTFYKELYRILKNDGKLYHFVGGGRVSHQYKVNYLSGVVRRLSEAGFRKIQRSYRGVVATKQ